MLPASDKDRYYELNGFLFFPDSKLVQRLDDHLKSWLYPQDAKLLELFLKHSDEILSKEKIAAEVWRISDTQSVEAGIHQSVHLLRQILGKEAIKTVLKEGYRFVGEVKPPDTNVLSKIEKETLPLKRLTNGYFCFILIESLLFATSCILALFLETAYKFEEFKHQAFFISFPIFALAFTLSLGCFWLVTHLTTKRNSPRGLIFGVISLALATGIIIILGCQILPNYSITETVFPQSQTAQIAYTKNLYFYLLRIFSIAVVIPFGSVLIWKKEIDAGKYKKILRLMRNKFPKSAIRGSFNFSVLLMSVLLLAVFLFSTFGTLHLSDNLRDSVNRNLFSFLLWGRNFLYFTIAVTGIWWYYEKRKEFTETCLKFIHTKS